MPISLAAAAQTYREAARDAVRRHSTFHLVQAALLVVAGIVAIVFPAFSSAAAVVVFGWLLIASVRGLIIEHSINPSRPMILAAIDRMMERHRRFCDNFAARDAEIRKK